MDTKIADMVDHLLIEAGQEIKDIGPKDQGSGIVAQEIIGLGGLRQDGRTATGITK